MTDANTPVPWATPFELEVRRDLADLTEHQRRQDRLLMELQLESRRQHRDLMAAIGELKQLAQRALTNGGAEHG